MSQKPIYNHLPILQKHPILIWTFTHVKLNFIFENIVGEKVHDADLFHQVTKPNLWRYWLAQGWVPLKDPLVCPWGVFTKHFRFNYFRTHVRTPLHKLELQKTHKTSENTLRDTNTFQGKTFKLFGRCQTFDLHRWLQLTNCLSINGPLVGVVGSRLSLIKEKASILCRSSWQPWLTDHLLTNGSSLLSLFCHCFAASLQEIRSCYSAPHGS